MDKIKDINKKINLYLMFVIIFLQGFVFYGPIATLYRQSRGISIFQIFLIESIFMILILLFEIPWGWFADRYGYKKTLIISNLLFFISKIVFYKAVNFEMFLLERTLLAISLSGISGCDSALIYSSVEEEQADRVFGIYSALGTAGFLLASLASTIIVKYSFDKTAFYTIFPYGLAALLTLFIKDTEKNYREKTKIKDSFKNVINNKNIIFLVVSVALIQEVFQAASVLLSQLKYIKSGIDISYFGILTVIMQTVSLVAVKSHKASRKFGKNVVLQWMILIIMVSCILLVFIDTPILTVILIVLIVGSMAIINPIIIDIQNKSIVTKDRATILSVYAMIGDVIGIVINPVIGKTADISVELAFACCATIGISSYIFFLAYKKVK